MSDHYTKTLSVSPGTSLDSTEIENEFDLIETGFDGLEVEVDQAIRFTGGGFASTPIIISDNAAARASKWLRFNSAGDAIEAADVSDTSLLVTPIPVASGGTGASTAAGARTNLGVIAGEWTYVSQVACTGTQSEVTFTDLTANYDHLFVFRFCQPDVDNKSLQVRTSSNNGSSYDSSASDYEYSCWGRDYASAGNEIDSINSTGAAQIVATIVGVGNGTNEILCGELILWGAGSTDDYPIITGEVGFVDATNGSPCNAITHGRRLDKTGVDAIRFDWNGAWLDGSEVHHYQRQVQ